MVFSPLITSENIRDSFRRYILSTFKTNSESYNQQLKEILEKDGSIIKGPYLQISRNFPTSKYISDLVEEGILSSEFLNLGYEPFENLKLFSHQEEAIRKSVAGKNIVVSTGTGSGKTESFIIPILNSLMRENENGKLGPGVRIMLLYPMNALANDQIERMREILSDYPDITFGTFTGETAETKEDAERDDGDRVIRLKNEIYDRETFRKSPPNILITNYAMLEHLLIKPENSPLFGESGNNHWKYIVLDEVHTYSGAKGSEVSMLLKRLKTVLGKSDIQFILTSATLGSEDENEDVARFASELCTCRFDADDVIRSQYIPMIQPEKPVAQELSFYSDIAGIVLSPDSDVENDLEDYLESLGIHTDDPRSTLYDIMYADPLIHRISEELDEIPLTVSEISERVNVSEVDLINIITSISATRKYRNQVFNAKYHLFVKGLDGAYVTLKGSEKLFIKPQKKYTDDEGKEFQVYKISTCYNCNAIYLIGGNEGGRFSQPSYVSPDSTMKTRAYMLMDSESIDKDDDDDDSETVSKYYTLCSSCGRMTPGTVSDCRCGVEFSNILLAVGEKENGNVKVCTCPSCGNKDSRRGLLRSLYLGNDAATAVIGSGLYADLLESRDHRILAFSDNRQAAAFFAPYMHDTYEGILMKRVIYEAMKNNADELTEGVQFDRFVKMVRNVAKNYTNFDEEKILESVVRECAQNNSHRSLEFLGFLRFEYGYTSKGEPWTARELFGMGEELTYNVINSIIKLVRDRRSVTIMNNSNFREYEYRRYVVSEKIRDKDGHLDSKQMSLWKSVGNYVLNFVSDEDRAKEFIGKIVSSMLTPSNKHKGSLFDLSRLKVSIPTSIFRCRKCRGQFPFSSNGICIRCNSPDLEEVKVNAVERTLNGEYLPIDLDMENHYVHTCVSSPLKEFRIQEHTAQLNKNKARDYQRLFKEQKIDALSCSTTFEMGVNIGTLNSVFMRNVPPTPANYVQRAGRAGRGEDASAFAVTYCREASHDSTYFDDPLKMINGKIDVPKIKIDNKSIVIRHIYATAFNFFWRKKGNYPSKLSQFVNDYEEFKNYLESKPDDLRSFLLKIVPESLLNTKDGFDIEEFGWTKHLFEGDEEEVGRLESAVRQFNTDGDILQEPMNQVMMPGNSKDPREMMKLMLSGLHATSSKLTLMDEETLNFLSRNNLIPKYGFPADVVSMVPAKGDTEYNLQRNMSIAISEFAPESEVIVDGNKYVSRYITPIPRKNWIMYRFKICNHCGKLTAVIDNDLGEDDPSIGDSLRVCTCGADLGSDIRRFIRPDMGFKCEWKEMTTSEKPSKTYATSMSFNESFDMDEGNLNIGHEIVQMISRTNGKLVNINRTPFMVCTKCGYSERSDKLSKKKKDQPHKTSSGKDCNGFIKSYSLGSTMQTDILILRFVSKPCMDYKTALSVLYALAEGLCRAFNIERNEVNCCLDNRNGEFVYILFDNTPGGSGYVKTISNEESFMKMVRAALDVVKNCTCGGEDGDSSCYACLRNYNNQMNHDDLIRGLARDYLGSLDLEW